MGIKIGNLNLGSAFVGNKAIQKIYIGNDLKWSAEEDLFDLYLRHELVSVSAKQLGNITKIGSGAFYNQTTLVEIEIPNTVVLIDKHAFYGCSSLTSVTIPNNVTSIGGYAFSNCTSLISVTIPDGITSIEESTFGWCSSLTSVVIPASVTSIGQLAFTYCTSLNSITYKSTMNDWNNITLGTNWRSNSSLTTVICTDGTITL